MLIPHYLHSAMITIKTVPFSIGMLGLMQARRHTYRSHQIKGPEYDGKFFRRPVVLIPQLNQTNSYFSGMTETLDVKKMASVYMVFRYRFFIW